eukprot:c5623_g1_i2.p2 GENE.c5623_g1_i2~~c5623_g1_i2.p2  ORF type:complete len:187 (+),score=48.13 c5623_g1_i2:990-1550(+)
MSKTVIAQASLVVLFSSILTTFGIKRLNKALGRRTLYVTGCLISVGTFALFGFLALVPSLHSVVFPACVVLGFGSAVSLVTAITIQADLVGTDTNDTAFVYGVIAFGDKTLNGVFIAAVELFRPACKVGATSCGLDKYFIYVMSPVCAASALLSLWFCWSIPVRLFNRDETSVRTDVDDENKPLIK